MDIIFDHQPSPICPFPPSPRDMALTANGQSPALRQERASSITTQESLVGIWAGARERGSTGMLPFSGFSAMAMYSVPALPDFSSPRFPDIANLEEAQRIQLVASSLQQFLAALYALGPGFGCTLRYLYTRNPGKDAEIRLLLIIRTLGYSPQQAEETLRQADATLQVSFPNLYRLDTCLDVDFVNPSTPEVSLEAITAIAEVVKPERLQPAWHSLDLCGFPYYYLPLAFAPAQHDMVGVCEALVRLQNASRLMIDITLQPANALTDIETHELDTWMATCQQWGRDQRRKVGGGLYSTPTDVEIAADPHASDVRRHYEGLLKAYGSPDEKLFLYAIRVLGDHDGDVKAMATTFASLAQAPGAGYYPALYRAHDPQFAKLLNAVRFCYVTPAACNPEIWQDSYAPETLRRIHRLVRLDEIGSFFRLPIPGRDGCPGVPLDAGLISAVSSMRESAPVLDIGHYLENNRLMHESVVVPVADITKHALVVGTPGSGKTTLCYSLLHQLWEEHHIPFIVLEPAKTEYRALKAMPGFQDDLVVFTPGNEAVAPFRYNPFEVPPGIYLSEHCSRLMICFAGAFNLFDPLPMIFEEAIRQVYADLGWSDYDMGGEEAPPFPTMQDFYQAARAIAERSSYAGEVAGNIRGAIETRIGSLLRGPKGRCFNTRRSVPISVLMERPVIFELESLNDDEKALLMMCVLLQVRYYAKSTRKSGEKSLRHVVLIEEAHNVIGRGDTHGSSQQKANPKEISIRFVVNMLAEMRALGEGLIIADQLPTAIAPEAIKSTNIKIMHRVVAEDDRRELGQAMVIDEGQFQQAAILTPGTSFVFMEGWPRTRCIREHHFKSRHPETEVPQDDATLHTQMDAFRAEPSVRDVYFPYPECQHICPRCDPRRREQAERWVNAQTKVLAEERTLGVSDMGSLIMLLTDVHTGFTDPQQPGCIMIHIATLSESGRGASHGIGAH